MSAKIRKNKAITHIALKKNAFYNIKNNKLNKFVLLIDDNTLINP